MIPTLSNAFVGYAVGTQVSVIGLYIAFVIPIILRLRAGESFERGAWHLGKHYKWIDWVAVIWIAVHLRSYSCSRSPRSASRGTKASPGTSSTTRRSWSCGALLLFGGWYVLSAHKWFKGPVRQGDESELERIEREYDSPEMPPAPTTGA